MPRKAASQIDWVMSLVFFIIITFTFISAANYFANTENPYESPMQSRLVDISDKVNDEIAWQLTTVPLTFESDYTLKNYPLSIGYRIDISAINSTIITDSDGNIHPTYFDANESRTYWIGDIEEGKNEYYLTYIENSYLDQSANTSSEDIIITTDSITNAELSVEYDTQGITTLIFNGIEFISAACSFGTSDDPLIHNDSVRAIASYPQNITATIFSNNSRIFIHSDDQNDFTLHLSTYLAYFHVDGTTYEFNGTNTYTGTTDHADLYDSTGIAIIGDDLDISIDDPTTERTVTITGATDFELYLHDGDHTKIINETAVYDGLNMTIGIKETTEGIRPDRIGDMEGLYYDEFQEQLGLEDTGIIVKVENI